MQEYFNLAKKLLTVHNTGVLKCMRIRNGLCTVSNSKLSYVTFIPEFENIDATVDAKKFIAACEGANYLPSIKQTDKMLSISKGSFKARIALAEEVYPEILVRGESVSLSLETFNTLKRLQPFVSNDVSRPWACGVMFDTKYAYATNNVVAARVRLDTPRKFTLPAFALTELLRASADVTRVTMNDNAVRFELSNGISLQSSLTNLPWPDIGSIIDNSKADGMLIEPGIRKAIESLVPLCANLAVPQINLSENGMATVEGDSQAHYEGYSFPPSSFHSVPLLEVLKVANEVNFAGYPKPCYFKGPIVEGVLMGLR